MSFFRALFDFSFSEYVTTKIIKILYVISVIFISLGAVGILIASFVAAGQRGGPGALAVIGGLIIAPIYFLVACIFSRVGYEILIVVFGIAENVHDMTWALTGGRKAPAATPQVPQYAPQPNMYMPPQQPQQYPPQVPPQQPPQQYPQYPQYPQQPGSGPQYPPKP